MVVGVLPGSAREATVLGVTVVGGSSESSSVATLVRETKAREASSERQVDKFGLAKFDFLDLNPLASHQFGLIIFLFFWVNAC